MIRVLMVMLLAAHIWQISDRAANHLPQSYIRTAGRVRWCLMRMAYATMAGIAAWLIIAALDGEFYPYATAYAMASALAMLTERRQGRRNNCNPHHCPQISRMKP